MIDVRKTYDAMLQDPVYSDYQKCKLALQNLVAQMNNPAINDGVSIAYTKISKWTS